ncbi:helix-turn-helix transcriptional regulator [Paraburkholderia sp. DGU8]|uniref:helix-turn-helix transcriptional regulator n=1 Tax=Paraburkholderia sp. DGU8 TaxID=3161997 RepID=UPI0034661607
MDYSIKTLSQLKPILLGFRKAAGLTQAAMASHLGVTQQTYAQLEANPATVSMERLFKVLRVLQVDLKLTQTANGSSASNVAGENVRSSPDARQPADTATAHRPAKKAAAMAGKTTRKTSSPRKQEASSATQARVAAPVKQTASKITRKAVGATAPGAPRAAAKSRSAGKKREDW